MTNRERAEATFKAMCRHQWESAFHGVQDGSRINIIEQAIAQAVDEERERCARECEIRACDHAETLRLARSADRHWTEAQAKEAAKCAAAIRERGR